MKRKLKKQRLNYQKKNCENSNADNMKNFDFVEDNQDFATLCQFCIAAEQNQLSDRNKSALSSRQALEYLVKAICLR